MSTVLSDEELRAIMPAFKQAAGEDVFLDVSDRLLKPHLALREADVFCRMFRHRMCAPFLSLSPEDKAQAVRYVFVRAMAAERQAPGGSLLLPDQKQAYHDAVAEGVARALADFDERTKRQDAEGAHGVLARLLGASLFGDRVYLDIGTDAVAGANVDFSLGPYGMTLCHFVQSRWDARLRYQYVAALVHRELADILDRAGSESGADLGARLAEYMQLGQL